MQKSRPILLLILLFLSVNLFAQPTLTRAVHEPQIGDQVVYTNWDNDGITPGPAGPNQTWNFTLQPHPSARVDSVTYSAPMGDMASLFPQSDIMITRQAYQINYSHSIYEFFVRTPTQLRYEGYANNLIVDGDLSLFNQPAPHLAYPFTYGTVIADSVTGTYSGWGSFPFDGWTYLEADAYGTLTVNGTTYNNVLRVHEWDSLDMIPAKLHHESWRYYLPSQRYPVLSITYNDMVYEVQSTSQITLLNPEAEWPVGVDIYPNPAFQWITCSGPDHFNPVEMEVFDLNGKSVWKEKISGSKKAFLLNVQEWPTGLYLVTMTEKNGTRVHEKLLVRDSE